MTIRRSGGDGKVLVEGVVSESQEEQSIDVMVNNEPKETICGSLRLDVRISDNSNRKMVEGLQKLLGHSKREDAKHSLPIIDVAFGRRKPCLLMRRDITKLSCAKKRDDALLGSDTMPQASCITNGLNQKQSEAVDMALSMEDIGVIHG